MFSNKFYTYILVCAVAIVGMISCVDREFDEPPFPQEEEINITEDQIITIEELLSLRQPGEDVHEVNLDQYIRGVVVADDQSGNFFKALVVQDGSFGITILLDEVELWNRYFVGNEVFIHLQDIWLADFAGLPQIGFQPVNGEDIVRIPAELIRNVILRGDNVGQPMPMTTTIDRLSDNMLNTLIQLDNVQFVNGSQSTPYADEEATTNTGVDHFIEDCFENEMILRTSIFADFADQLTPDANGPVVGVLGKFNESYQLTIRNTNDVDMMMERCDGGSGPSTGTGSGDPIFSTTFDAQNDRDDIELGGWINVPLEGTRVWQKREFDGNGYAQLSAFNDDVPLTEGWLISPGFNTSERGILSFRTANAFHEHDGLTVLYSTNFDGAGIRNAEWIEINATLADIGTGDHNWLESGDIDLTGFGDEIHIAFRYLGTGDRNTTTFRIDDIDIR